MERKEGETILWELHGVWNVLSVVLDNTFLMAPVFFFFSLSIFFEPEVFFSSPGELPTKENGGVALLKGKKVQWKYYVQDIRYKLQ